MKRKKNREIDINNEYKQIIISGLSLVFGVFCLALCYNLFFFPNNIVVGGTSGLAMILEKLFNVNRDLFIYISSFALLLLSYILLGKESTSKTLVGSILYPIFITFTKPIADVLLKYLVFEEYLIVIALSAMLYGFSNGIIYKFGYTTGGSDVVMRILCKYCHFSEGVSSIIFNAIIIFLGALTFGVDMGVYAIIILIVSSLIIDKIIIGISTSKKFMIYTRESKKVKKIIEEKFQTGFTIFPTVGGYSHIKGAMIMCVIRNRDVTLFKQKIKEIDPTAFFVISDCYEVQGGIKRSNLPFI